MSYVGAEGTLGSKTYINC